MSLTGGRSKDTPRYLRGTRPAKLLARTRAMRPGGQRQSEAVLVLSSITKPLPSHMPRGQSPARSATGSTSDGDCVGWTGYDGDCVGWTGCDGDCGGVDGVSGGPG